NVAPTITAYTVPASGAEGSLVTLSAAATDPAGANDRPDERRAGTRPDGTTLTTLTGATVSFTPPDDGNYLVSLTVSDGDGGSAVRAATVAVANVAPTITTSTIPASGDEGSPITVSAVATDPAGAND